MKATPFKTKKTHTYKAVKENKKKSLYRKAQSDLNKKMNKPKKR